MSDVNTVNFAITLAEAPSQIYSRWLKQIRDYAPSICVELFSYGLLFLVIPRALYITFPKCLNEDGQPLPYPNLLRPENNAGGAGTGTVGNTKKDHDAWIKLVTLSEALRQGILKSLGEDIELTQTDPVTGICTHDTNTIMANMAQMYGVVTSADITQLRADLAKPLSGTDHTTFSSHAAQFQDKIGILLRAGQPLSQWDQQTIFEDTCSSWQAVAAAIRLYIQANPVLAARTLAALIAYTQAQLLNVTASASGLANAASSRTSLSDAAFIDAVADKVAQKMLSNKTPRQVRTPRLPNNFYCYHHGTIGHKGKECKYMAANSSKFTPAMINSRSPSEVAGGHV
jgi:hypothetical protein